MKIELLQIPLPADILCQTKVTLVPSFRWINSLWGTLITLRQTSSRIPKEIPLNGRDLQYLDESSNHIGSKREHATMFGTCKWIICLHRQNLTQQVKQTPVEMTELPLLSVSMFAAPYMNPILRIFTCLFDVYLPWKKVDMMGKSESKVGIFRTCIMSSV